MLNKLNFVQTFCFSLKFCFLSIEGKPDFSIIVDGCDILYFSISIALKDVSIGGKVNFLGRNSYAAKSFFVSIVYSELKYDLSDLNLLFLFVLSSLI